MKLGTMLRDVTSSFVRKPITEKYPFERKPAPERLRGRLQWRPEKCTGCGLCVMDCPAGAIEMFVLDKKAKRFVLTFHLDRCTFCAQCVHSCRQDSLELSSDEWELAALSKGAFTIYFGEDGDVREALAREAAPEIGAGEPG